MHITFLSCFVLGASPDESYRNLLGWLDRAASRHLPLGAKATYADDSIIKGVLHHMSAEQCNGYLRKITSALEEWASACYRNQMSCGTVLRISAAGDGQCGISTVSVGGIRDTTDPHQ